MKIKLELFGATRDLNSKDFIEFNIEEKISTAQNTILISTPRITSSLADKLIDYSKKGIKIKIITIYISSRRHSYNTCTLCLLVERSRI